MGRIPFAKLNEKQAKYIKGSRDAWLNVAEGGKRAGKNIMNLLAWAMCLEKHPDKIHLAAGVSIAAAKMNILDSNGFGLQYLFAGRCRKGRYMDKEALFIRCRGGEKVVVFAGGGRSGDAALIKGNSYGSAYITEVNECHQGFVQEVLDRTLASRERKLFMDLNPKPPRHWFYTDFLDDRQKSGEGLNYGHFTIADNMSIGTGELKRLLATYDRSSVWYKADILGQRTAASGRIYTGFNDRCLISPEEIGKTQYQEWAVGVDVGGTDATAATLIGFTRGYREVHLLDGLYHKQGISDRMSEDKYARLVAAWICEKARQGKMLGDIHVDSAAKLFRAALREELAKRRIGMRVIPSDKGDGILQRIELTCMLLMQGRLRAAADMAQWHEAMEAAVWDEGEYEKGGWARLDNGSYPVDALDAAEYSVYPMKRFLEAQGSQRPERSEATTP